MTTVYTFVKDVDKADWVALPRKFLRGESVFRYDGHDYGLVRDDLELGDRETVACSLDVQREPFFTVPVEFLVQQDGTPPVCEYVRVK